MQDIDICGEDQWGPWQNETSDFTRCFQEWVFTLPAASLLLFNFLIRMWEPKNRQYKPVVILHALLSNSESGPMKLISWIVMLTLTIAVLYFVKVLLLFRADDWQYYELAIEGSIFLMWFLNSVMLRWVQLSAQPLRWHDLIIYSLVAALSVPLVRSHFQDHYGDKTHDTVLITVILTINLVVVGFIFILPYSTPSNSNALLSPYESLLGTSTATSINDPVGSNSNYGSIIESYEKVEWEKYPEMTASFFPNRMMFMWFSPTMKLGHSRPLEVSDILPLVPGDNCVDCEAYFLPSYEEEKRQARERAHELKTTGTTKRKPFSIARALIRSYFAEFMYGGVFKLISDSSQFVSPFAMKGILRYLDGTETEEMAYIWVIALFFAMSLIALAGQQYHHVTIRVGLKVRTTLLSLVYKKVLVLSTAAKQSTGIGKVVNLISSDAQRVGDSCQSFHQLWSAPYQISITLYLLYDVMGASAFFGIASVFFLLPVQAKIAIKLQQLRKEVTQISDKRMKKTNELLQGISIVKLFAWETSFQERIASLRSEEMSIILYGGYIRAVNVFLIFFTPLIIAAVSFIAYVGFGNDLTNEVVFVSITLFFLIQSPLLFLPMVIGQLVETFVSIIRLNSVLDSPEIAAATASSNNNNSNNNSNKSGDGGADRGRVCIQNGNYFWEEEQKQDKGNGKGNDKENKEKQRGSSTDSSSSSASSSPFMLQDINFDIKPGSLALIVGQTGSGKSSVLSAILGEIPIVDTDASKSESKVLVEGSVAYVPQVAWIYNATLKNNILFGLPFEEARYRSCIRASQLEEDLKLLPAGEETEIGEKGINLSGGQKQRVSLARALYSNADVYILDDCLSAVDAHVGKEIFEKCIRKGLKGKTVIMALNQLQYVPSADHIIMMDGGQIVEQGSYSTLMANDKAFAKLMRDFGGMNDGAEGTGGVISPGQASKKLTPSQSSQKLGVNIDLQSLEMKDKDKEKDKDRSSVAGKELVEAEERASGAVEWRVYKSYILAAGGMWLASLIIVLSVIGQFFGTVSVWWLGYWSSDTDPDIAYYISTYIAWSLAYSIMLLFIGIIWAIYAPRASTVLHNRVLGAILRAPMSFFDVTPLGRIMNRFSKDLDNADMGIPFVFQMLVRVSFQLFGMLFVITFTTPIILGPLVPLIMFFYFVQDYYRHTSRELRRLESITRSPIFVHLTETMAGLTSIRAYKHQTLEIEANNRVVDTNTSLSFSNFSANRWLGTRLEISGAILATSSALLIVLAKDTIDSELAGLSLSYSVQVTFYLTFLVRMYVETENAMNSVERLLFYGEIASEKPYEGLSKPPKSWPNAGKIEVRDISLAYRPGLPNVLKGLSFTIKGGEKIGVCGRTGSGKSSLLLALFRIVECNGGSILIDGVDISTLGLRDLRSRLIIISQNPILFEGTVRSNLDPFQEYDDTQLWSVLEHSQMKDYVTSLPGGLGASVQENGENFSVGQRQLLCLARAMLRKGSILMIDEATASIDVETDKLIQTQIHTRFADKTVITIAHRLDGIVRSDKVLVLEAGEIKEFDSPKTLLANAKSSFSLLVAETGPTTAEYLRKLANEKK